MDGLSPQPHDDRERSEPAPKKKGPKKAPAPDEIRCTATVAKGRCRFARIPVGHKPAADAPLSPFCGHHLGDLRRGGKSSDIEWGVAGAAELVGQPWLPLRAPLLALRVMATHRERAQQRLQEAPHCCKLVHAEKPRTGKTVTMLFAPAECTGAAEGAAPAPPLHAQLQGVAADRPLARVLATAPAIVQHAAATWEEAAAAFGAAAAAAAARGASIKLLADPAMRKRLLGGSCGSSGGGEGGGEGSSEGGMAGCAAHGHSQVFWLMSLYGGAAGYVHGTAPAAVADAVADSGARDGQVCKAVHKIEEALRCREWLEWLGSGAAGAGGAGGAPEAAPRVALDIGASPGSWSAFLHDRMVGGRVVAVDPADLAPEVLARPGICHVRACASAEDAGAMAEIKAAVAGGHADATAQLVVCDMNRHPKECAACIAEVGAAGLLSPGCRVVLTLKMVAKSHKSRVILEAEALQALGDDFDQVRVDWLFSNTQFEATVTCMWHGER